MTMTTPDLEQARMIYDIRREHVIKKWGIDEVNTPLVLPKPPKEKVSAGRFIIIDSLKYNPDRDGKTNIDIILGLARLIPVVSLFVEMPHLVEIIKKRIIYEIKKDEQDGYVFDMRFSTLSILSSLVHAVGLGILLIPIRISATIIGAFDSVDKDPFDNPHFLNKAQWHEAVEVMGRVHQIFFEPYFPEEGPHSKTAYLIARREHNFYPEMLFNTLYPDQEESMHPGIIAEGKEYREIKNAISKVKKLRRDNLEFNQLFLSKEKHLISKEQSEKMREDLINFHMKGKKRP